MLLLSSCTPDIEIISRQDIDKKGFNELYQSYCDLPSGDHSSDAVLASFVGEYKKSMEYAALNNLLGFRLNSEEENERLKNVFHDYEKKDALEFISEQSKEYHFTLINEAHYSSTNRAFTTRLLKPLWNQGYRYLGLEALGYNDPELNKRKYPTNQSGYYIKESSFGNLVREALEIGFTLIPYETQIYDRGDSFRDGEQARNLVAQTWEKDKQGKVLIHVGYGHLGEYGDEHYKPMGSQLRKIVGQDILTIDQQAMLPLGDQEKMHSFYQYAQKNYNLKSPSVFIDKNKKCLVDDINEGSVDIQVYHPIPGYIHQRPKWLISGNKRIIELPKEFGEYKGHLLQVLSTSENDEAVPLDQFVITDESFVIVKSGKFKLRVINCDGTLVSLFEVEIS